MITTKTISSLIVVSFLLTAAAAQSKSKVWRQRGLVQLASGPADAMRRGLKAGRHHRSAVFMGLDGRKDVWGTGVVIWRSADKRQGLVLTVAHNLPLADQMTRPHIKIDGKRVPMTAVVAKSDVMDYAVVRVELPKMSWLGRLGSKLGQVIRRGKRGKLSQIPTPSVLAKATETTADQDVYMAGYPGNVKTPISGLRAGRTFGGPIVPAYVPSGEGGEREQQLAKVASATINRQINKSGKPFSEAFFTVRGAAQMDFIPTQYSSHSGGVGFSGAPVYSAKSHRVMGIHHANNEDGPEYSYILPTKMILRDLATKMSVHKIDKRFNSQVGAVLQQSGVDAKMMKQWGLQQD